MNYLQIVSKRMESKVTNEDCMALMARYPDKYFDLAVTDPPYGIKADRAFVKKTYSIDSRNGRPIIAKKLIGNWDNDKPSAEYFKELKRVSRNQIIWGANHFISRIPFDSSCWIVWDKDNGNCDQADCELAYTSFHTAVRKFTWKWSGMLQQNMKSREKRIHPTQKPVALYDWIFQNYAKEGDKILDTHLGSGSSRIAAWKHGLDFTGCELDAEYFEAQERRFADYISQLRLF